MFSFIKTRKPLVILSVSLLAVASVGTACGNSARMSNEEFCDYLPEKINETEEAAFAINFEEDFGAVPEMFAATFTDLSEKAPNDKLKKNFEVLVGFYQDISNISQNDNGNNDEAAEAIAQLELDNEEKLMSNLEELEKEIEQVCGGNPFETQPSGEELPADANPEDINFEDFNFEDFDLEDLEADGFNIEEFDLEDFDFENFDFDGFNVDGIEIEDPTSETPTP